MTDPVRNAFLRGQLDEGLALARDSDLVDVIPFGTPADHYLVHLSCRGLVRLDDGSIREADEFVVGIQFPEDYLRVVDPFRVLTWMGPRNIWHPNISATLPVICVGRLSPGTGLVDLIYQVWEIVTWNKVTMREDDALNHAACQWARANLARLPVDSRPLKRRPVAFRAVDVSPGADHAKS